MNAEILIDCFIGLLADQSIEVQDQVWCELRDRLGIQGAGPPWPRPLRENYVPFNPKTAKPHLVEISELSNQLEWEKNGGLGNRITQALDEFGQVITQREQEAAKQVAEWPKSKRTEIVCSQVQVERKAYDYCVGLLVFYHRIHAREKLKDELVKQLLNLHEQNYELAYALALETKERSRLMKIIRELSLPTSNQCSSDAA